MTVLEKYGYPLSQWNRAKGEMRDVLIDTARRQTVISYSDLVARVQAIRFDPYLGQLRHMLGEICEDENALGRGLLTAIVVYKSGDIEPGPGWYAMAAHLGYDVSTQDAKLQLWSEQMKKIYAIWSE